MKLVDEIISESGHRKIEIYLRENGTYGFEAFKFGEEEDSWFSYGNFSHGIFDSLEAAMNEAKSRVEWLS